MIHIYLTYSIFNIFVLQFQKKNLFKECTVRIERLDLKEIENKSNDENINTLNKNTENHGQTVDAPAKRYRTRSSVSQSDNMLNGDGQIKPKKSSTAAIPRPKPAFIEYKGKVEYFTDFHDIAFASDNLL